MATHWQVEKYDEIDDEWFLYDLLRKVFYNTLEEAKSDMRWRGLRMRNEKDNSKFRIVRVETNYFVEAEDGKDV